MPSFLSLRHCAGVVSVWPGTPGSVVSFDPGIEPSFDGPTANADAGEAIAALAVLAVVWLGFSFLVRGRAPWTGHRRRVRSRGNPLAEFVSFTVVYTLGFDLFSGGVFDLELVLLAGTVLLVSMFFMQWVETAVKVTAIALLLMKQVQLFGDASLSYSLLFLMGYLILAAVFGVRRTEA